MQDSPQLSQPIDNAPVVFEEAGEAGSARGTVEGTEIVKESYEPQALPETSAEEPVPEESSGEIEEMAAAAPAVTEATEIPAQQLPVLYEPTHTPHNLPSGAIQPDVPVEYAAPTHTDEQPPKPKRKRAAWHQVGTEARAHAAGLNISKHVRAFTDQQYDAYGTPDGTGGSTDYGTGTGGGGSALHHANINSLDLIKQSYMRKVVRAIVAQSNFLQYMAYSSIEIHKITSWRIEIGPDSKIKKMISDETCSASIDEGLRKIFYSTQLPSLPSRLKEGFTWNARISMHHPAHMAPLLLEAATD